MKAGDKNRYNLIVDWLCELLCGLYMGADAVDRGLVERACESISQPHKKHSNLLQSEFFALSMAFKYEKIFHH